MILKNKDKIWPMSEKTPLLWVISEGMVGTENQCLGIAEALDLTPVVKRIGLNEPWKTLSPYLGFESETAFNGDELKAPWPDILISSGRKSIAAARYIKKMSRGHTFTVQVQDPRLRRSGFDLIVVPEHDPGRGSNIFVTTGTPNRITNEKISEARDRFSHMLEPLPPPRVAVLIGGSTNTHKLDATATTTLANQLLALARCGTGLMITTSRRTGEDNVRILNDVLQGSGAYIWDGKSENPYFGFLAWADAIIVTSDSMGMISEAATTGKPVYAIDIGEGKKRHKKMMENFVAKGIVRSFTGSIESWTYEPLQDASLVAKEIRRRTHLK